MPVEPIDDHVAQADALFIDEYTDLPRTSAWLASYTRRVQEFEAAAWQVIALRNIDAAGGVQLDALGRLVGQERLGLTDSPYRIRILTRIRANTSLATPTDVIEVATLAGLGPVTPPRYLEFYPAGWVVDAIDPLDPDVVDPEFTASIMRQAGPAGVGGHLHFSEDDEDETFAFATGDVEELDTARGLSDDDGTTGGKLIGVF